MKTLLKKYFGYSEFRDSQEKIINNVILGNDTLVLMPTGGGKSLCFQIPALYFGGLTIVISPLISLMKDQVDALNLNGIGAEYLNSKLLKSDVDLIRDRILNDEIKLLYVTPERIFLKSFKIFLKNIDVSLIAIDEAHCISEWGHDFRKDYRNLKLIKSIFPNIPIIALTATATFEVKNDIFKQLKLKNPKIFISSFNRDNLNLIVRDKKNSFAKIVRLLEKNGDNSSIIYCHSRKEVEQINEDLNKYGFKSVSYHAGLSSKIREVNQELFIKDKVNIVVATIAFGMGIDKSNVRLVIHNTFSKSIENYYQEIGRAGRDGLSSDCVLFYSSVDKRKHEFFLEMISNSTTRKNSSAKLNKMISFCESNICRKKFILNYFDEKFNIKNCGACDICLKLDEDKVEVLEKTKIIKKKLVDKNLLSKLKLIRKKIAVEIDMQASLIFSDVSLRDMTIKLPRTEFDFLNIVGVTNKKLNDFGEDFLICINEYLEILEIENNLLVDVDKIVPFKVIYNKSFKKKKYSKKLTKYKKYNYKK